MKALGLCLLILLNPSAFADEEAVKEWKHVYLQGQGITTMSIDYQVIEAQKDDCTSVVEATPVWVNVYNPYLNESDVVVVSFINLLGRNGLVEGGRQAFATYAGPGRFTLELPSLPISSQCTYESGHSLNLKWTQGFGLEINGLGITSSDGNYDGYTTWHVKF